MSFGRNVLLSSADRHYFKGKMKPLAPLERDYYDLEEGGSDDNRDSDSSDDEVQKVMAKIAGIQRPKKEHSAEGLQLRNDAAEFESDMEDELNAAFKLNQDSIFTSASTSASQAKNAPKGTKGNEKEDSVVDPSLGLGDKETESDEEFLEAEGMRIDEKNDMMFYDPGADDRDEAWAKKRKEQGGPRPNPRSDAVLNCPACMSLLSLDCQRHDVYKSQYRAMFVENCSVNQEESVYLPSGPMKKAKKRPRKPKNEPKVAEEEETLKPNVRVPTASIPENATKEDYFHPVTCAVCHTEVGFSDSDELYHFFNVLSSYT